MFAIGEKSLGVFIPFYRWMERGRKVQQIVHFDETLKERIKTMEMDCDRLSKKLLTMYAQKFQMYGIRLIVELIRLQKGKPVKDCEVFAENYESFIELGVETDEEYFPNAYIPIWKCKKEMFQFIGYLTSFDIQTIEIKMSYIIEEMLQEIEEEFK